MIIKTVRKLNVLTTNNKSIPLVVSIVCNGVHHLLLSVLAIVTLRGCQCQRTVFKVKKVINIKD